MTRYLALATLISSSLAFAEKSCGVLDHQLTLANNAETINLCEHYEAKAYLIVNTASHCAFTPQYGELESLHKEFGERGLVILAIPSNDFFDQEPLNNEQIVEFCETEYDVSFPIFSKSVVTGDDAIDLYKELAEIAGPPRWNFYKYLINSNGVVIEQYSSMTRPENKHLHNDILSLLAE